MSGTCSESLCVALYRLGKRLQHMDQGTALNVRSLLVSLF